MPTSHFCIIFSNINTIHTCIFFNTFSLCSQLQLLESVHCPIALKSSLSGGILESMCAMDYASFVKVVLSPLSGSTFRLVTPSILFYCLPNCIAEYWRGRPFAFVGYLGQTLFEMAEYCSRSEWCPLPVCSKIGGHSTWAYVL